ncbi:hypothetical protein [Thiovibrio frasassiensis]|jgi:hypothetical protein|uniref:Penicillin-binding protein activator LpoB n=1 Tax=Thiovibrio frasassiensis TaxID=2984131 RepID=A0A9X4MFZ3_9BACT|nr:hypothetical protein [Thiovibrio frasassiensis]MDG4474838.1 hypothetical protein [Thiovibrio frasassiensis]
MQKTFVGVLLVLLLSGCASPHKNWANQPVEVKKNSPVVFIHPDMNTYQEATVGVLPFQMPDNMTQEQGEGVGMLFKDVLLGKQAFPKVVRLAEPYRDMEEALALGRKAKVDLVLAGKVNYALEGTQFGGGRVEVATRLLNVHTGNTVWYIEQSMDQPVAYPKSSTFSRFVAAFNPPEIKPSQAGPVIPNMLAQVAFDMAEVMAGARSVSR